MLAILPDPFDDNHRPVDLPFSRLLFIPLVGIVDSPSTPERDARLADVLESFFERAAGGETVEIEKELTDYPDLADDLRMLWATAQVAGEFSSLAGENTLAPGSGGPAVMPKRIGQYSLIEEIGRGGMGVVFKAQQQSPDRTVALKMILRGNWAAEADMARFRAEAESAAHLEHPNIVPVYEVGEHEGQPFFSMRYIDGLTISELLHNGPMPPQDAAELLLPVCRAIAVAHDNGVLHRDLKPSNIMVGSDGTPYITDFGLAKRVTSETELGTGASLTSTGDILGTPGYMAPEQAASQRTEIGPHSDVYGLGAVLYAMLTGQAPFQANSPVDIMLQVLEQDPVPPRVINQDADIDLEMIALKCLQKPVNLRYRSAEALADDLKAYLADEPISARSSHFTQIISRALRETHHATVLENWGLLWMWHSLVLMILCLLTNWLQWRDQDVLRPLPWTYLALWGVGVGIWALIFWNLRKRSGPVTFVERQIAHTWAGSMASCMLLFLVEYLLGRPPLDLSPALGLICGMVFLVKAGILSGQFYIPAVCLFISAPAMALIQHSANSSGRLDLSISLFGLVSAGCFFFPGLKYHRQRRQRQ